MTCNDYLSYQKSLTTQRQDENHSCINPFGNLLFTQSWKWAYASQNSARLKPSNASTISLKNEILAW
jgi:hypothetical protein